MHGHVTFLIIIFFIVSVAAFPRIFPDRLQFFEYETVSVSCEEFSDLTEWRVMRKLNRIIPTNSYNWNSSASSCTIYPAFKKHSGEYWCEDAEGKTSGAVNITVTGKLANKSRVFSLFDAVIVC